MLHKGGKRLLRKTKMGGKREKIQGEEMEKREEQGSEGDMTTRIIGTAGSIPRGTNITFLPRALPALTLPPPCLALRTTPNLFSGLTFTKFLHSVVVPHRQTVRCVPLCRVTGCAVLGVRWPPLMAFRDSLGCIRDPPRGRQHLSQTVDMAV